MIDRQPSTRLRLFALLSLGLAATMLAGCGTRSGTGPTAALASTGRLANSATYIAALQGGIIAKGAGQSLSSADRQRALEAEYRALEAAPGGQPVIWQGSKVRGSVVATAPYQVGSQNCRQYSHTVTMSGSETVARGVACRNSDGSWTPLT
ncbi:hypothetical protein ACLE20_00260 [Rhizobium sp. YIM 134829]|jgi:surface antigen|uniref:hypothetical protein n=1 Tax=Rhizobium sp. YIM 134829 TaxID=3390453 RepID=UPI00397A4516